MEMSTLNRLAAIICFLMINLLHPVTFATEWGKNMNGKLISSIDLVPLIHEYDSTLAAPAKALTEFGATYQYKNLPSAATLFIQVAVYESIDLAIQKVENQKIMASVGPNVSDQSIGDHYNAWTGQNPQSGGILYRRKNAVFHISGKIEFNIKKAIIMFIEHAIMARHKAINLSDALPRPAVNLKDFKGPAIVHAGSKLSWSVETYGLALSGLELGVSNAHSAIDSKNNKLYYYAGPEAKEDVIKILIWQSGNLFSVQPFKIKVVK
ncbi:MAG: hypothetical protein A2504_15000 [Bdellovibrionales bacterium RIFOXYD12_FULL_39_22]|nr:MAG: hypothetical protein A2485_11575 [Bdellovibrionales bacterium RIFOXYC12_FULL_39_17]OFZ47841.1 MAG: hypothetical protein A2404_16215 [Bdellovibrionales bacterium RIFOXYC1_FULL_39_130]OFZ75621.1 MAG: hypothetical protein A2560_12715 [Bdellovibrionales bacterium RIFOXYD1_FULL_39_84]OFZ94111.1 MAG: hypothetical protein A2504_15000 [Bdellovibrionales bacterium RIFOXYD12_FULL_39_22]